MKNKNQKTTILFILTLLSLTILYQILLQKNILKLQIPFYFFIKDIFFISLSGVILNSILNKKDLKNARDLKALEDSNNEIKESNDRYDIVAKATSDTIWDWKIEEDKLLWNKGIESVFGYKQSKIGKSSNWWFENIHPEDSLRMSVKLYSFIEQKTEKWQDEYRFKCADGSYKFVLDRGFLLKDANGKAVRMIGAIQDVTKQKEEEQRLKLLETVVTQTKDSIIITEAGLNSNKTPKIVYANPSFIEMSGYNSEEIIGQFPNFIISPDFNTKEYEKLIRAIENNEESELESISHKKNQEEYWINSSLFPVNNSEGELSHWVIIQRDISDRKKQEVEKEQLIRELTRNNKDLQQFSYITSHNLRAPLSNLTGLLNLIEDIPVENIELKEILKGFKKSTYLLNDTINDLIKVIVIKDNPSIQKENVQLYDVFENIFSQLNFLIGLNKPSIKINFEEVDTINTNKAYLESIILNLMTNSLKYKSEERKLKINISTVLTNDTTTILFSDNGIGIDLDRNSDKIFGLYQRFHNHTDGKGLGLYLVKSQVEIMGGNIHLESEVNIGTTFTLTFNNK